MQVINRVIRGGIGLFYVLATSLTMARAEDYITIATGSTSGLYYPMGTTMCRLINKGRYRHGVRCRAEPSQGSLANLQALRGGRVDFAILQSDWQAQATDGVAGLADGTPFSDLRSVLSLHAEVFTVVARKDSGIETFSDLRGHRVNIGNPGSGQRATMEVLMQDLGWSRDSFSEVHDLPAEAQSAALCAGEIDAMVFVVGPPPASIEEATTACDSILVSVNEPRIRAFISADRHFDFAQIPARLYRGNPDPVRSFGVAATLVTTRQAKPKVVEAVVKAVFTNLNELRQAHPAFRALTPEVMAQDYQTAPQHRAARAYYRSESLFEPESP
ncbi:TAXI family TRAP transporter solute-binding subunit [Phaeobacter sp. HF9A]|uniref:TAXI family TRAP transporter solute-binding subunit n=1 Tax=Phaeobacter sp. HF9A TaxID=2721561 RepID=UPI00142F4A0C|nr:TAXI family TRAP transporter solute-binding subunit [Phaeobacter sp. HF9A]NIZ15549.1 TAXI family TRAP transporter solute-binding subunit [Phaeobacter sp. HF9A]